MTEELALPFEPKPSRREGDFTVKHGQFTPREHRHSGVGLERKHRPNSDRMVSPSWAWRSENDFRLSSTAELRQKTEDTTRLEAVREGLEMLDHGEIPLDFTLRNTVAERFDEPNPDAPILTRWNTLRQTPANYSSIQNPTFYQGTLRQIDIIGSFAGMTTTTSDGKHIGDYARTVITDQQSNNRYIQPEVLIENMIDIVDEQSPERYGRKEKMGTFLRETGALSLNPSDRQPHLFNLFYTFANLYKEKNRAQFHNYYDDPTFLAFQAFPFKNELVEEYKRKPDSRFGDALLVTCSLYERDQMKYAA